MPYLQLQVRFHHGISKSNCGCAENVAMVMVAMVVKVVSSRECNGTSTGVFHLLMLHAIAEYVAQSSYTRKGRITPNEASALYQP